MPGAIEEQPKREPVDVRILAGFAIVTLLLVLPAAINAVTPADRQAVADAASAVEAHGRAALAVIDHRDRISDAMFAAELEDIAAAVQETRSQLERESVDPAADAARADVASAADDLGSAVDDASLLRGGAAGLAKDRDEIAKLVSSLQELAAPT